MHRVRPHQVLFGIGLLVAVFTLASGVAPALTHWGDTSRIRREVFGNVPTAVKVAFYAAAATMLLLVGWLSSVRVRNCERGRPDDRRTTRTNAKRRARDFGRGVVIRQRKDLRRSLGKITRDGFRKVHVLRGLDEIGRASCRERV